MITDRISVHCVSSLSVFSDHWLCSLSSSLSVISDRVSVHCVSLVFVSSDHWLCSLCSGIIGCVHCPYLCPLGVFSPLSCALFVFSVCAH